MKKQVKLLMFSMLLGLVLVGCSNKQSLQQYYVDSAENPNFMSVDLPLSLLAPHKESLSAEEQQVLSSLRKLNVLAFAVTDDNRAQFVAEKAKVDAILDGDSFEQLMKLNSEYGKGVVKFLGDEDAIDEVVVFGSQDDKGFLLVRVLGDDMNPAHLMTLLQAIEKSGFDGKQLEAIKPFFE